MRSVFLGLTVAAYGLWISAAVATGGPADCPAPMFGLNIANTGQSTLYGPTTAPQVSWSYYTGNFTYSPRSLALGSSGLLYGPFSNAVQSSSGKVAWTGSGNGGALDSLGHVYSFDRNAALCAHDAVTGALLWTGMRTNVSSVDPIKISPDGTVYGTTFNGDLYAYSPSGTFKWKASLGSVQYGEVSHIPALDPSGNLYLSGGAGLRSLDPAGQVRWSISYAPFQSSVVMLAPNGNVVWQRDGLVETRDPQTGTLLASFSQSGTLQAMDSTGNLYFSGGSIVKATASGQQIWSYSQHNMDWPITVDAAGNVYCGDRGDGLGDVIGLSSSGTEMWKIHLGSRSSLGMYNTAPIIGPDGQLFVSELGTESVYALVPVPEPTSLWFLGFGAVSLLAHRRKCA